MQKLGWRASDTRELSFQGARVPEENLLGPRGEGFRQFMEILDGGRISVAAMGVGLAQGCYDLASTYALEREQFGRPIAKFQSVQAMLVDMATEIEAARDLVWKAAWEKDQGRDFGKTAAMAKLFSGELSHRAANWALQIHGGYGFMDEYAISRLYRDQKILEIGEGTNEVQRMVIAQPSRSLASPQRSCSPRRPARTSRSTPTPCGPARSSISSSRCRTPPTRRGSTRSRSAAPVASCSTTARQSPAGRSRASGQTLTWKGGNIPLRQYARFGIRGTAPLQAGTVLFNVLVADRTGSSLTYRVGIRVVAHDPRDNGARSLGKAALIVAVIGAGAGSGGDVRRAVRLAATAAPVS